jgi:diguanylate cyclase (GGDEF)-like protein
MRLDLPTLLVLETLASLVSAIVLGVSLLGTAGPGAREATLSMLCLAPAFALYLLRERIPGAVSVLGSNLLFWIAALLIHRAVTHFSSGRPPARWPLVFVVAVTPLFAVLASSGSWYGVRVLITSAVLCVLVGASVRELVRAGGWTEEPSRGFAVALLGLASLGLAVRIVLVLPHWRLDAAPLAPTPETMLAFVPALLLAQGFGPAFLLMQRERSAALAARLATVDALTGCLNRRALEDRARIELAHAARMQRSVALVVVDLDHFKQVNDTHGHATGDALLRCAGRVLRSAVRPGDVVARFGGEEFCLLLREADPAQARAAAERLRASLAAASIEASGAPLSPRASIGVASRVPDSQEGWETLFRDADAALYRAKRAGRDRVCVHGEPVE